jgi:hypothetical protein
VARQRDAPPPRVRLDLGQICETADQVLELVRREWRPQQNRPDVNDWNDEFLVAAFARAFRCLRSVREIACRGEADDAAVLTRALIALTLRYLWVGRAPGDQRRERLERLRRKAAEDRATLGEELELVGHLPAGTSAEMRAVADELKDGGVKGMPDDRSIAKQLDRELHPEAPHWFETLCARVYRWTSEPAHYGWRLCCRDSRSRPSPDRASSRSIAATTSAPSGLGLTQVCAGFVPWSVICRLGPRPPSGILWGAQKLGFRLRIGGFGRRGLVRDRVCAPTGA